MTIEACNAPLLSSTGVLVLEVWEQPEDMPALYLARPRALVPATTWVGVVLLVAALVATAALFSPAPRSSG